MILIDTSIFIGYMVKNHTKMRHGCILNAEKQE